MDFLLPTDTHRKFSQIGNKSFRNNCSTAHSSAAPTQPASSDIAMSPSSRERLYRPGILVTPEIQKMSFSVTNSTGFWPFTRSWYLRVHNWCA